MERTLYYGNSENCCAYCKLHECAMTVKQMRRKNCLQKQCFHLQKREEHEIWAQRARLKRRRQERKQEISAQYEAAITL